MKELKKLARQIISEKGFATIIYETGEIKIVKSNSDISLCFGLANADLTEKIVNVK